MRKYQFWRAVALFVLPGLWASVPVCSQAQTRTIEWPKKSSFTASAKSGQPNYHITDRIEDIEIESILVEGRLVTFAETFSASEDWIKNIAFRIRNVSNHRIQTVQISMILPEMPNGSPQIPYCFGCSETEKAKGIAPGAAVELPILTASTYSWARGITEKAGLSSIGKAEVYVIFVTMPDGTTWSSGCARTTDLRNGCLPPLK